MDIFNPNFKVVHDTDKDFEIILIAIVYLAEAIKLQANIPINGFMTSN
jgi:hypothetical protein